MKFIYLFTVAIIFLVFPSLVFAQQIIGTPVTTGTGIALLDNLAKNYGQYLSVIVAFVIFFDRMAKITPTQWDNKTMTIISGILYKIFAVAGLKVPDVDSIEQLIDTGTGANKETASTGSQITGTAI